MIEIHSVVLLISIVVFASLLLLAWIGGWHTASRHCKQVAENYGELLAQVNTLKTQYDDLLKEHMALRSRHYQLEDKYNRALQDIRRLSSNIDALRRKYEPDEQ
jgi:outer membrane murein-binding lipoprotein Lpp